jgi:hypothetical protein
MNNEDLLIGYVSFGIRAFNKDLACSNDDIEFNEALKSSNVQNDNFAIKAWNTGWLLAKNTKSHGDLT